MTSTAAAQQADQIETIAPDLQYEGRTPYVEYIEADVLQRLVHLNTDEPLEATFVIVTQIMEMHFGLLRREWQVAIARLRADNVKDAVEALRRSKAVQDSLVGAWNILDMMSPVQYIRFRDSFGKASGFQSFTYRELEFLIGAKDANMLRPHSGMTEVAASLRASYEAPSLYDEALALLARRGLPVPAEILARDPRQAHVEGDEGVVEAWRQVYLAGGELADLAEALIGLAERYTRWRLVHYTTVRRILGSKPGTGGSAGLKWLKRAADTMVFPELWEVRSVL
jgi:tryptophan 2,3-dioxygenase